MALKNILLFSARGHKVKSCLMEIFFNKLIETAKQWFGCNSCCDLRRVLECTGQFINVSDVLISCDLKLNFIIFHNLLPLKLLQTFTRLFLTLNTKVF